MTTNTKDNNHLILTSSENDEEDDDEYIDQHPKVYCTICFFNLNHGGYLISKHPDLPVPICLLCHSDVSEKRQTIYRYQCNKDVQIIQSIPQSEDNEEEEASDNDIEDSDDFCSWCFTDDNDELFICKDGLDCSHQFCQNCIRDNLGEEFLQYVQDLDSWECFICNPTSLHKLQEALEYGQSISLFTTLAKSFDLNIKEQLLSYYATLHTNITQLTDEADKTLDSITEEVTIQKKNDIRNELKLVCAMEDLESKVDEEYERMIEYWNKHRDILEAEVEYIESEIQNIGVDPHRLLDFNLAELEEQAIPSKETLEADNAILKRTKIPEPEQEEHKYEEEIVEKERNIEDFPELSNINEKIKSDVVVQKYINEKDLPINSYPPSFTNLVPYEVLKAIYHSRNEKEIDNLRERYLIPAYVPLILAHVDKKIPKNAFSFSFAHKLHPSVLKAIYHTEYQSHAAILFNHYNIDKSFLEVTDFGDIDFIFHSLRSKAVSNEISEAEMQNLVKAEDNKNSEILSKEIDRKFNRSKKINNDLIEDLDNYKEMLEFTKIEEDDDLVEDCLASNKLTKYMPKVKPQNLSNLVNPVRKSKNTFNILERSQLIQDIESSDKYQEFELKKTKKIAEENEKKIAEKQKKIEERKEKEEKRKKEKQEEKLKLLNAKKELMDKKSLNSNRHPFTSDSHEAFDFDHCDEIEEDNDDLGLFDPDKDMDLDDEKFLTQPRKSLLSNSNIMLSISQSSASVFSQSNNAPRPNTSYELIDLTLDSDGEQETRSFIKSNAKKSDKVFPSESPNNASFLEENFEEVLDEDDEIILKEFHTPSSDNKQSLKRERASSDENSFLLEEFDSSFNKKPRVDKKNTQSNSRERANLFFNSEPSQSNVSTNKISKNNGKSPSQSFDNSELIEERMDVDEESFNIDEVDPFDEDDDVIFLSASKSFNRGKNLGKSNKSKQNKDILSEETKLVLSQEKKTKRLIEKTFEHFTNENGIVLNQLRPPEDPAIQIVDSMGANLKPHQIEGLRFLWQNVIESYSECKKDKYHNSKNRGCVIAHSMGLGKTFTIISFIVTLLTNPLMMELLGSNDEEKTSTSSSQTTEIDNKKNNSIKSFFNLPETQDTSLRTKKLFSRFLILAPKNAIENWGVEFTKWTPPSIASFTNVRVLKSKIHKSRRHEYIKNWFDFGGVLIMGYEMFRLLIESADAKNNYMKYLANPGPDIVIADEAHIIKNSKSKINICVNKIKSKRRIALTGTPLQNNLFEYWYMVDWVRNRFLMSEKEFRKRFFLPIRAGEAKDADRRLVNQMKKRTFILHKKLEAIVHRRDWNCLTKYLPPKREFILHVKLAPIQLFLYKTHLSRFNSGKILFRAFQTFLRVWNHPACVVLQYIRDLQALDTKKLPKNNPLLKTLPSSSSMNLHNLIWKKQNFDNILDTVIKEMSLTQYYYSTEVEKMNPNFYEEMQNQLREEMNELTKQQSIKKKTTSSSSNKKQNNSVIFLHDDESEEEEDDVNFEESEEIEEAEGKEDESDDGDQIFRSTNKKDSYVRDGFCVSDDDIEYDDESEEEESEEDDDESYEIPRTKKSKNNNKSTSKRNQSTKVHNSKNKIIKNQTFPSTEVDLLSDEFEEDSYTALPSQKKSSSSLFLMEEEDINDEDTFDTNKQDLLIEEKEIESERKIFDHILLRDNENNELTNNVQLEVKKLIPSMPSNSTDLQELDTLSENEESEAIGEWWRMGLDENFVVPRLSTKQFIQMSNKTLIFLNLLTLSCEAGDKMVLFSQSINTLNMIEVILGMKNWGKLIDGLDPETASIFSSWSLNSQYVRIDGTIDNRQEIIENFNKNLRIKLILISTKAGNTGINLTSANRIVIYDASWNPVHDVQASARVYRFGQTKSVFIYRLVSSGTLEEKIYKSQVMKQTLSARVVDAQMPNNHFTEADRAMLLALSEDAIKEYSASSTDKDIKFKDILNSGTIDKVLLQFMEANGSNFIVNMEDHDSFLEDNIESHLNEDEKREAEEEYEKEGKPPTLPPPAPLTSAPLAFAPSIPTPLNSALSGIKPTTPISSSNSFPKPQIETSKFTKYLYILYKAFVGRMSLATIANTFNNNFPDAQIQTQDIQKKFETLNASGQFIAFQRDPSVARTIRDLQNKYQAAVDGNLSTFTTSI